MHLTLRSRARKVFAVQLYKNNARALLSRILTILNSDWLHHAHTVRRVCESANNHFILHACPFHLFQTNQNKYADGL